VAELKAIWEILTFVGSVSESLQMKEKFQESKSLPGKYEITNLLTNGYEFELLNNTG